MGVGGPASVFDDTDLGSFQGWALGHGLVASLPERDKQEEVVVMKDVGSERLIHALPMARFTRASCGLILVVLVLPWPYAYGQSECPFPDSVAVADTLDPRGYYPTQVGNVWEYIVENGPFIEELQREEIVADTLIDGTTFFKRRQIRFKYDPFAPPSQVITDIKSEHVSYFFVTDSSEVFWTEQGLDTTLVGFDRPFNSCYEDRSFRFLDSLVVVMGGYQQAFEIEEDGVATNRKLPAIKTFEATFTGASFGHGVGRIATFGDPSVVTRLSYARVSEQMLGTPLDSLFEIRVANEPFPTLPTLRLENYPNPFVGVTRFSFSLSVPGSVTLEVIDVLGRVIARPLVGVRLAPGRHERVWDAQHLPSGVYFARLVLDTRIQATTKVLHLK